LKQPPPPSQATLAGKGCKMGQAYIFMRIAYYPSTLANMTVIILFSEMLKIFKKYFFQIKKIVKDNSEQG
jgi:hypothetical protein